MAKTGRRPAIDPEDVLEVFENGEEPFLSTGEVAERVEVSKPTVRDRLQTLEEQGAIRSRKLGGNTPAWYLPAIENYRLGEFSDDPPPDQTPRADGSPPIEEGQDGRIRPRLNRLIDKAEEELARERAIYRMDLRAFLERLMLASLSVVLGFVIVAAHLLVTSLPEWVLVGATLMFLGGLAGIVVVVFWYLRKYTSEFSQARDEISTAPGDTPRE